MPKSETFCSTDWRYLVTIGLSFALQSRIADKPLFHMHSIFIEDSKEEDKKLFESRCEVGCISNTQTNTISPADEVRLQGVSHCKEALHNSAADGEQEKSVPFK